MHFSDGCLGGGAATVTADAAPLAPDDHAQLLERFVDVVGRTLGFRDGPQLRAKLAACLAELEPHQRQELVSSLGGGAIPSRPVQEVVRRIAVHETFFYRDAPQLDLFRQQVLPALTEAKRRRGDYTYRIWSAGCSTGEEAYTWAMLILEHLMVLGEALELSPGVISPMPGWQVSVLGTDMAFGAVVTARGACYADFGLSPFRDCPPTWRRFFQAPRRDDDTPARLLEVRPGVRSIVSFDVHNLLGPTPPLTDCDIVCCRNVMIYFDDDGKRRAQGLLDRALKPGGHLLLGPTDTPMLPHYTPLANHVSPILRKPG